MKIPIECDRLTQRPIVAGAHDTVAEALRDLAHRLYRQPCGAWKAEISDPALDEALAVNSFTFPRKGKRFG